MAKDWLRIWDLASGAKRFELAAGGRSLQSAALVGPGSELIATGPCGVGRIRWKPEDLIGEACRRLGRDFRPEEWRRFLDEEPPRALCSSP